MMEMENKQKRVPAADFVRVWQGCESRQEVADRLGVTYGSVASREKTLRKAGVNIKQMERQQRGIKIDADALNALIAEVDG